MDPISLADAKLFLRVDISDDDALITSLITVAREYCETFTGLDLTDDSDELSETAIQAMRLIIAHFYSNREPVVIGTITSKLPFAAESLLWSIRTKPLD